MIETSLIAAGIVVTAGRWAENKNLDFKIALGMVIVIIMLNLMATANESLAEKFALAILLAAVLGNIVPIAQKLGYSASAPSGGGGGSSRVK